MELTQQTITVYNRYSAGLPPFGQIKYDRTVIKGVSWEDDVAVNPDSTGKATIGQTVLILLNTAD